MFFFFIIFICSRVLALDFSGEELENISSDGGERNENSLQVILPRSKNERAEMPFVACGNPPGSGNVVDLKASNYQEVIKSCRIHVISPYDSCISQSEEGVIERLAEFFINYKILFSKLDVHTESDTARKIINQAMELRFAYVLEEDKLTEENPDNSFQVIKNYLKLHFNCFIYGRDKGNNKLINMKETTIRTIRNPPMLRRKTKQFHVLFYAQPQKENVIVGSANLKAIFNDLAKKYVLYLIYFVQNETRNEPNSVDLYVNNDKNRNFNTKEELTFDFLDKFIQSEYRLFVYDISPLELSPTISSATSKKPCPITIPPAKPKTPSIKSTSPGTEESSPGTEESSTELWGGGDAGSGEPKTTSSNANITITLLLMAALSYV